MEFPFWNTQPVTKFGEKVSNDGIIDENLNVNPPTLPDQFGWCDDALDAPDTLSMKKLSSFLNSHFHSNMEFDETYLKWLLKRSILVTMVVKNTGTIVGFLAGERIRLQINRNQKDVIVTSLLCVHPKLRGKKMVNVLVKKMITQCGGDKVGIFSTDHLVPKPFCQLESFTRPINIQALLDAGYAKRVGNIDFQEMTRYLTLPDKPLIKCVDLDDPSSQVKLVELKDDSAEEACLLLNNYLEKYNVHRIFSMEEFTHLFLNNDFVKSYVLIDNSGKIVDMFSFSVTNYKKNIKMGTMFYYTSDQVTSYRIVKDVLILAKLNGVSSLSTLNIMENEHVLRELGFDKSDKPVFYNFYNFRCRDLKPKQIGLII